MKFILYLCNCKFSSGHEIWHYDIIFLTKEECIFNKYSFPSISEVIDFYTENRLGKVFLEPPVRKKYHSLAYYLASLFF